MQRSLAREEALLQDARLSVCGKISDESLRGLLWVWHVIICPRSLADLSHKVSYFPAGEETLMPKR